MCQRLPCILMQQSCILHAKYVHIRTLWHYIALVYYKANIRMQCGMGSDAWEGDRERDREGIFATQLQSNRETVVWRSGQGQSFAFVHCRMRAYHTHHTFSFDWMRFSLSRFQNFSIGMRVHAVVQLEEITISHLFICLCFVFAIRSLLRWVSNSNCGETSATLKIPYHF